LRDNARVAAWRSNWREGVDRLPCSSLAKGTSPVADLERAQALAAELGNRGIAVWVGDYYSYQPIGT
jgi:hypothetical protein